MEPLACSSNTNFLVCHVLRKAGPDAHRFFPLLRRMAVEARVTHGKVFTVQDVEDAIGIFKTETCVGVVFGEANGKSHTSDRVSPDFLMNGGTPTPVRNGLRQVASDGMAYSAELAAVTSEAPAAPEEPQPSLEQCRTLSSLSGSLSAATDAPLQKVPASGTHTGVTDAKLNLRLRGTSINVRANPPRLQALAVKAAQAVDVALAAEGEDDAIEICEQPKRARPAEAVDVALAVEGEDSVLEICQQPKRARLAEASDAVLEPVSLGLFGVPRLLASMVVPQQTLRISAGRAAAVAGIHPFTDVGELFLELVYQDLPDLMLRDAEIVGIEIVSPDAERAKLIAKSGEVEALEKAIHAGSTAAYVEAASEAQKAMRSTVAVALEAGRLTAEEASELQELLQKEVNLDFGERHEDAAIEVYEANVGFRVFGQQRRVSLALPEAGPDEALLHSFPPLRATPLPRTEDSNDGANTCAGGPGKVPESTPTEPPYFRLTGFVDGLVDLPRDCPTTSEGEQPLETVVVEVKHRMASIKDPPNIYDVVQLCCYCRAFGLTKGHLVQCLRKEDSSYGHKASVGKLHVSSLDFSEGSPDRTGWDEHVLPSLYKAAAAVYAARADESTRLRLLATTDPKERAVFVGQLCFHLGR